MIDKKIFITIILTLLTFVTFTQDFRNVNWGQSEREVKNLEQSELVSNKGNSVAYNVEVSGLNALLVYYFNNKNQLCGSGYLITIQHSNDNFFVDDYKLLKDKLISEYGEPTTDEINWYNNFYKDDYSRHGFAVSLGHVSYETNWQREFENIRIQLTGDNYYIMLVIVYASKKYQNIEKINK